MKNLLPANVMLLTTVMFVITFNFADAQSQSNVESISRVALRSSTPPSVQFLISIPDEYSSRIIQENVDNGSYFKFRKTDGSTEFLFQVNRISENQWIAVKNQLSNTTILDHKNGFVYYAQVTDKSRIKGVDAASYEQVYGRLRQLISTIVITDGEM